MRGLEVDIDKYISELTPYMINGSTLHRACRRASIPYTTVMDYIKTNEEVRRKIEALEENPITKCEEVLMNSIDNGDVQSAKWFLERRNKEDYSQKVEQENKIEINESLTMEDYKEMSIEDLMNIISS